MNHTAIPALAMKTTRFKGKVRPTLAMFITQLICYTNMSILALVLPAYASGQT